MCESVRKREFKRARERVSERVAFSTIVAYTNISWRCFPGLKK